MQMQDRQLFANSMKIKTLVCYDDESRSTFKYMVIWLHHFARLKVTG